MKAPELVLRVGPNTFRVNALVLARAHLDLLLHAPARGIVPSADAHALAGHGLLLAHRERRDDALGVEDVRKERASGCEDPRHLAHDAGVLGGILEGAERREEVHDRAERARAEGKLPHVGAHAERARRPLRRRRAWREEALRQVEAHHAPEAVVERDGVPARPAREIQESHAADARERREKLAREDGLLARLPVVALGIEGEVLLPEPLGEPGIALERHRATLAVIEGR